MTVKKWLPCAVRDFQGIQDWLNEQAAAGYALGEWPHFSDGSRIPFYSDPTAPGARYRLEPVNGNVNEKERNQLYAQMGWQYITQIRGLYSIFRCDDPPAPELYTDPESLSFTMKTLIMRQWVRLALFLMWCVFFLWDEIKGLFTAPAVIPMKIILSADVLLPLYLLLIAYLCLGLLDAVGTVVFFRRLRRRLAQGLPPKAGKRRYQAPCGLLFTVAITALVVILAVLAILGRYEPQRLEGEADWAFPHITLAQVLSPAQYLYPDAEYGSFAHSWLAPEQYRVHQDGAALLADGSRQEGYLNLHYTRTISPVLAGMVYHGAVEEHLEDLRKYFEDDYLDNPQLIRLEPTELSHPAFDRLTQILYQFEDEEAPRCIYVGQMGSRVVTLSTSRTENHQEPLDLLAQQLLQSVS